MKPGPLKQFDPDRALVEAMRVFGERGYEAASLSELTAAMGIGKKSLYDTFGNKRSLFLQALEKYTQINTERIRSLLLAEGSPIRNLRSFIEQLRVQHSEPGSRGCLIGTCIADFDDGDEQVSAVFDQKLQQIEAVFAEALEQAREAGELSPETDIRDTASMLVCLTQGLALVGRVKGSPETVDRACTAMNNLLANL
ncbi:TetR/AcrR family transcriptional regulator [Haloferula helveola]